MNRLRLLIADGGQEFELFQDSDDEYYLLPTGSPQYHGPFTTEARAEDEADFLALTS